MSLNDYQREIDEINKRLNKINVSSLTMPSEETSVYIVVLIGIVITLIITIVILILRWSSSGSSTAEEEEEEEDEPIYEEITSKKPIVTFKINSK